VTPVSIRLLPLLGLLACGAPKPTGGTNADTAGTGTGTGTGTNTETSATDSADTATRTDSADTAGTTTPPPDCDFYAAPEGGGEAADGSAERPWGTLETMAAANELPATGGVVCLLPGHHGAPRLRGLHPTAPLTVRALDAHQATVSSLIIEDSAALTLQGLVIDGVTEIDPGLDERDTFLLQASEDVSPLTLLDLIVQSADSSADWTWDGWWQRSRSGVDLRGPDATVLDCTIRNVHHALSVRGDDALVQGNTIDNFGGDGIRGLGSGSTYAWNTVRDAYIDEYEVQHDDAFQAYELEGDLRISDVTIAHNRFLLFTDPLTDFVLEQGLVGTLMQGVIITDGYADGWVVENNLVVNSHPHGISLYGARNSRIQNNTVVAHPAFVASDGPWIRITDQEKTGQENFDNIVRNNLTAMLTPWDYDDSSIIEANLEVTEPDSVYADVAGLDFHLLPGTDAIDGGIDEALAESDLDGAARRVGAAVDLGAFERQEEPSPAP